MNTTKHLLALVAAALLLLLARTAPASAATITPKCTGCTAGPGTHGVEWLAMSGGACAGACGICPPNGCTTTGHGLALVPTCNNGCGPYGSHGGGTLAAKRADDLFADDRR